MFRRAKRILILMISAAFIICGSAGLPAGIGDVFAEVGSITDGEDISYDKTGGVLASMGFDTSKMPEDYDPDATTNPYGSDVSNLNEVDEALLFDLSHPMFSEDNKSWLYGHNRKLNGDLGEFLTEPVKNVTNGNYEYISGIGNGEFIGPDDFVSAVKCDITGDGRDSAVAIVYTHYNADDVGKLPDIFLCIYDPLSGKHSDNIRITSLFDPYLGRINYNYQVQSQLQITAGDYDKDSVDEIAVYAPGEGEGERNKVMVFDLTDGKECENPLDANSWRHSWNYMLPYSSAKILNITMNPLAVRYAANIYNNVDLTSGDADNDGIDDLIISYGASDTDYVNKGANVEGSIKRSIPSRSVLLYGSDTGQMLRDSQDISYGGQELIRVSFAFGDVDEDGNEDMFLAGQLRSEQGQNVSRVLGRYLYDQDTGEMMPESIQNMSVVNGNMADTDDDGTEDKFVSANGWDEKYYSAPLMNTNLAVGNISGSAGDVRIYLDSVLYSYDGGNFEISDELEDDSQADGKNKGSAVFAGNKAMKDTEGNPVSYYEFGADCANFTASASDQLTVNRVSVRKNYSSLASDFTDAKIETASSMLISDGQGGLTRRDPLNSSGSYTGITNNSHFRGASTLLIAADTDKDGLIAEYTGEHEIQYQDPAVLAVLASPPYFKDVAAYDENDLLVYLSTDYGSSSGDAHGYEETYEGQVGIFCDNHIGTKAVYGIANLAGGYARAETWGWEKEREFRMGYGTEGGEDAVVMYSVPTENYIYKVKGVTVDDNGNYEEFTNTTVITKPHKPVTQTLTLEDYVEIQKRYPDILPDVTKYLTSTPGDPSSYPSSQNDLSDEAKSHIDWDTDHPIDYAEKWAGTAFGSGSITQEISYSHSNRDRYDNHLDGGWGSIQGGAGFDENLLFYWQSIEFGATYDFSQMRGSTYATLTGADCSGTIKNMPRSAKDYGYGFSWKLLKFNIKDKNCTFPVVTYMVTDVTAPPELPDNIEQDFERSSDSEITLTWTYNHGNPQYFDIYRYEDFPIGGGDKLIGSVAGSDYKIMKDEDGNTLKDKDGHVIRGYSFTDTDLTADTKYKYRMKVRTAKLPGESIFSPVIEARTDVGTKPEISLSADELTIYPDSTYNIKALLENEDDYQKSDISYQWQKYDTKKRVWEDLEGCTKQLLHFYRCAPKDAGIYRCRMNLIRKRESSPQYISAFTESCNVSFSLRSVQFSDISVFEGEGNSNTNTGLYVNVSNTSQASLEKPTGMVVFDIDGPNGNIKVAGYIDENTGDVTVNSIEDRIGDLGIRRFVDGGYVITCSYAGNAIFYPAKSDEEHHYLRNIDASMFLSLRSEYYFGEDLAETMGLFEYSKGISGKITRKDHTDKITKVEFYQVAENGIDKTGGAVASYDLTQTDGKALIPLNKKIAGKAYVEVYTDGNDAAASKVITTRKIPLEIDIIDKTTGTGRLLSQLTSDDVELSNGIRPDEENIETDEGRKSLSDFMLFRYYHQNGDYICSSDDFDGNKGKFLAASYKATVEFKTIKNGDNVIGDAGWFYTPVYKGGRFMVVGNYYLLSAGPEDGSTGSVRMISPDKKTDFTREGYVGGTRIMLKAEPNPGYEISKWIVDDCGKKTTYPGTESFNFTVRSENTAGDGEVDITAVMKPKNNKIKYGHIGSGSVSVTPEINSGDIVLAGTKLTFTATPEGGWRFVEWRLTSLGGNNIVSGGTASEDGVSNTKEYTMPDSSAEVYAVFAKYSADVYAAEGLEVLYVNDGGDPYHDEGEIVMTEKGKNVPLGSEVIVRTKPGFTLEPETEWNVLVFKNDGSEQRIQAARTMSQGREACKFVLPEDAQYCTVYADTERGIFTVRTDSDEASFTISVDGDVKEGNTVQDITGGSQVDITATPVRGRSISGWIINGEERSTNDTIFTCNITENMNVSVTTEPAEGYSMGISAVGGGTLEYEVSDSEGNKQAEGTVGEEDTDYTADVYQGESILFRSAAGDNDYTLTSISVNGEKQTLEDGEFRITDVSGNINIKATFSPNTYFSAEVNSEFIDSRSSILNNSGGVIENGEIIPAAKNRPLTFDVAVPSDYQPYVKVVDAGTDPADADYLTPEEPSEDYGSGMTLYHFRTENITKDVTLIISDHAAFYIRNAEDLTNYFSALARAGQHSQPDAVLLADINMSRESIESVSDMYAHFDGNGHKITGLTISDNNDFRGLFGTIHEGAEIRDVVFDDLRVYQEDPNNCGLLADTNEGIISRVSIIDSVFYVDAGSSSDDYRGGFAYENQGTIEYSMIRGLTFNITNAPDTVVAGGVVYNGQGDSGSKASMTGNYFENIGYRTSADADFLQSNVVALDGSSVSHKGSFTANHYLQTPDSNDTNGKNAFDLAEEQYETAVQLPDDFFRELAYEMNKELGEDIYGVSRDPSDRNIYVLIGKDEEHVAPIKVEYVFGKKVTVFTAPGKVTLPGEDIFGADLAAWEVGSRSYLPGEEIDVQNDTRIVGISEDDFDEYTAKLTLKDNDGNVLNTVYYKNVDDAIAAATEHGADAKQELQIIGNAVISAEIQNVSANTTIIVGEGVTLKISANTQVNNKGIIKLEAGAVVDKYGSLMNEGSIIIDDEATLNNYGRAFNNVNGGTVTGKITCKIHIFGKWTQTIAPTCSATGKEERTCEVCGVEKEERVVDKKPEAHDWGEWIVTKEATEIEEGEETRTCKIDASHTETRVIPIKDHVHGLSAVDAAAATCEENGNTKYWVCSEGDNPCGRYFSDAEGLTEISIEDTITPAPGHDWGDWKVTKEATETAAGEKQRVCKRDPSHIEKQTIPANGNAPATDPNQRGTDGTAVGPGASAAAAEKAIVNMKAETDPEGSVFAKLKLRSPKQTKTSISLKWTRLSKAEKYVIYGNKCGKTIKPKKLATVTGTTRTFKKVAGKKLKKGTYYNFIVVALDKDNKVVSTSKLIHVATKGGKVTNHKLIKFKKTVVTKAKSLKKGKTLKLAPTAVKQVRKLKVKKHTAIRYESTNKDVATVSKSGIIKGVKNGTCYVYTYAQNGIFKSVKVVVK